MTAEIQAERVAFTAWDLRAQEQGEAAHNQVTAAREAAADALDETLAMHMRAHFCMTSLAHRDGIPLQLQAALQAFADAAPQKDQAQILRLSIANLAARAPVEPELLLAGLGTLVFFGAQSRAAPSAQSPSVLLRPLECGTPCT